VDYDPAVIPYEKLLDVFWGSHNPFAAPWSKQYMSIVFYHNDEQKSLAEASRDLLAERRRERIFTEFLPFTVFYAAEDYHQKYRLRSERDLMRAFRAMYPGSEDLMNSTAAARVNGYLDGYGFLEDLLEELPGFGLSPAAGKRLMEIVKGRKGRIACKS
jgi:peptide-methionine (S)-S-oxide reductase